MEKTLIDSRRIDTLEGGCEKIAPYIKRSSNFQGSRVKKGLIPRYGKTNHALKNDRSKESSTVSYVRVKLFHPACAFRLVCYIR